LFYKSFSAFCAYFFTAVLLLSCSAYQTAPTDMSKTSDGNLTTSGGQKFYLHKDKNYVDHIRSVTLHPEGNPLLPPIIDLQIAAPLRLRFDDLKGGYENYYYSVTHCNFEWEPSSLLPAEYIRGFAEMNINEAEQSFNTVQPYTNYTALWPNDMSVPLLSGNYLLKVYADGNEDAPVFTRRIVVTEQLARFRPNIKASTIVSERRYRQEVDFDLIQAEFQIFDPYRDLHIAVLQNHRWDNAILDLEPVFMKGQEITYDYDEENNFDGLNEYRWFDSKSLRYAALGTDSIRERMGEWHYYLAPDLRRTYEVYRTDQDINGKFIIRNDDFNDNLESEYIYVHFYLPMDHPLLNSEVYVFGGLTRWNHIPEAKMKWNAQRKRYEATLYLKQGYYNYMYSVVDPDHPGGDQALIEGNHQATENKYTILAYCYDPMGYDRVIGVISTNSFNE
jgi:hypothetical protein